MINELTTEEYMDTMTEEMIDVTETTDDVIDIWPYAQLLAKENILPESIAKEQAVEIVYRNEDETYEHVLLATYKEDTFVVIVIDLEEETIIGHYLLKLDAEGDETEDNS